MVIAPLAFVHGPRPRSHTPTRAHHHFSPPCTEVSAARRAGGMEDGIKALEWAVEYPLALGYESWSVETVVSTVTRRVLDALVEKHTPERLSYLQVEAADLGTPQTRLRYIIGPPKLIARRDAFYLLACAAMNTRLEAAASQAQSSIASGMADRTVDLGAPQQIPPAKGGAVKCC